MITTDLWTHLKTTDKPIALYGTGDGADKIINKLKLDGTFSKVKGIFASSGFVRERYFYDFRVESYESCHERLGDMIVLMCFGSFRSDVIENAKRIASECEFYAPDVPVYGTNIFDTTFYEENKSKIDHVTSLLADELSVKTMRNTVTNKLTGDILPLEACETTEEEINSLFTLEVGSTYVDLGAYNGDTISKYTSVFPGIETIHAVEPDKRNFRKLKANTEELSTKISITYHNAVIGDKVGTTFLDDNKGRGVHEGSSGIETEATTVDAILNGSKADFIKFDVEGNELIAIEGAKNTIATYKPAMNIACYHRSEDIFTIPLKVLEINPDYKVYMRHLPHIPGWDTEFIFV